MEEIKGTARRVNDRVCAPDGFLRGFCAESTRTGNELIEAGIALAVQYLLPIGIALLALLVAVGNIAAFAGIFWLAYFNPIYMVATIPVLLFDAGFVVLFVVVSIIATIIYWIYFARHIGVFAMLPLAMWFIGFLVSFLPYIGSILSGIIGIMPWMAIAVVIKWIVYNKGQTILPIIH